jgi:hypothetical protein
MCTRSLLKDNLVAKISHPTNHQDAMQSFHLIHELNIKSIGAKQYLYLPNTSLVLTTIPLNIQAIFRQSSSYIAVAI